MRMTAMLSNALQAGWQRWRKTVICARSSYMEMGDTFEAGVDLKFQSELAAMSAEENEAVSQLLTELMRT